MRAGVRGVHARVAERLGRGPALVMLSVVASLLMGLNVSLIRVTPGLDPSYVYGLNYAAAHRLRWGRDFISTFGPYGYLVQTMDLGDLVWMRIAFSLLVAVGLGIATAAYLGTVPGLGDGGRLGLMLAIVYAFSIQDPEYALLTLFLLVFLAGLLGGGRAGLAAYAVAAALAGFYLLVKFSLGFSAAATVVIGCALTRRPRLGASRLAVTALVVPGVFLAAWALSGGGVGDVGRYVATAWEVSQGYSSAMSAYANGWGIDVAIFLLWFVLLVVWVVLQPAARSRMALAGLAFPLFAAWKHSVVRQDEHVAILARFGVFVMLVLLAETLSARRWRSALPAFALLLALVVSPWATLTAKVYAATAGEMVVSPLAFRGLTGLLRLAHIAGYRDDVARSSESALARAVLPDAIRRRIGDATVDVYPWEASYVAANALSWHGRPLPESFNGYTPALDGLNAAFFRSPARPEYVIWHAGLSGGPFSIDGRHVFWDEPLTLRAILDHYAVVEGAGDVIVLRAVSHPRFEEPRPLGVSTAPWRTWIAVPQGRGIVLAAPALPTSRLSRFVRALFREDGVYVLLRFDSGELAAHRLVVDNMANGVWVSPLPTTFPALMAALRDGAAGPRVVAIQFVANALVRWTRPVITVSWYDLLPRRDPESGPAAPARRE